jgi:hypothetical protein
VLIAVPIVLTHRDDIFALPQALRIGGGIGLIALAIRGFLLYRAGLAPPRAAQR